MFRNHSCRLSVNSGLRAIPALLAVCCLGIVGAAPATAQSIVFQEGFNDAAAAARFIVDGRGQNPEGVDGPGMWDFNFLVDTIGLPAESPEKRASASTYASKARPPRTLRWWRPSSNGWDGPSSCRDTAI